MYDLITSSKPQKECWIMATLETAKLRQIMPLEALCVPTEEEWIQIAY